MLTITKPLNSFETYCSALGYTPESSLFFDIETTGLSAANSMVFLIGTVYFDGVSWQLTQFLAQSEEEESEILKAFFQLAQGFDTLLHFNGTTFDIPFLKERANFHSLPHPLSEMNSLDLYQRFRPLKKILNLSRMNQQTLEQFLSWPRQDQLAGKHMISLFKKYAVSGEQLIADLLLLHNHDDLVGMTQLLKFASYQMLFNGEIISISPKFIDCSIETASPHSGTKPSGILLELNFQLKSELPVSLSLNSKPDSFTVSSVSLEVHDAYGALTIPCICGELKYFFSDYKNYYYLPLEDQAIHKSIGAYVDPDHRENAKPANCYTRKTGIFLPQPQAGFKPVFQFCHNDKELYLECNDEFLKNDDNLFLYLKLILRHLFM